MGVRFYQAGHQCAATTVNDCRLGCTYRFRLDLFDQIALDKDVAGHPSLVNAVEDVDVRE